MLCFVPPEPRSSEREITVQGEEVHKSNMSTQMAGSQIASEGPVAIQERLITVRAMKQAYTSEQNS
ncbi:hypothetical protein [Streptomyces sp. NPDC019539]|uniref:hypothetical protein n=1 Tax=Streptomyces sp. NPDC019539 TaxID=3365063 RepID=UPI0037ABBDBB